MADYQAMYFHMMRETEKALTILIEAQRACEEMYLRVPTDYVRILPTQEGEE